MVTKIDLSEFVIVVDNGRNVIAEIVRLMKIL